MAMVRVNTWWNNKYWTLKMKIKLKPINRIITNNKSCNLRRVQHSQTKRKTSVSNSRKITTASRYPIRRLSNNMLAMMEKSSVFIRTARRKSFSTMVWSVNLSLTDIQSFTLTTKISSKHSLTVKWSTSLPRRRLHNQLSPTSYRYSNSATIRSRSTSLIRPRRSCKSKIR